MGVNEAAERQFSIISNDNWLVVPTLPRPRMSSQVGLAMSSHQALSKVLSDTSRAILGTTGSFSARYFPLRPLRR